MLPVGSIPIHFRLQTNARRAGSVSDRRGLLQTPPVAHAPGSLIWETASSIIFVADEERDAPGTAVANWVNRHAVRRVGPGAPEVRMSRNPGNFTLRSCFW